MKTRTELRYLFGWVAFALLLLSPVLLRMSESLTEGWGAMPSVHAQLVECRDLAVHFFITRTLPPLG